MNISLNILYFRNKHPTPSKYVRVLEPLHYLCTKGHKAVSFESLASPDETVEWDKTEKALSECNILLISNVDIVPETFHIFQRMVSFCNQHKKLIIYDFDDIYDQVPESNPFRKNTLSWDFVKKVIGLAHVITVTGKELQQALAPYHSRIFIVPNLVDCTAYTPRSHDSPRIRIGWAGGITHLADLPLFAESIRTLQQKYKFEFIVFGMFPDLIQFTQNTKLILRYAIHPEELTDPFHQAYVDFIRNMEGIQYRAVPAAPYHEFPKTLSQLDLDIGLCPVHDHLFNRCRSAIKFYQYAAVQTATLASNIYPYNDEPVVLVENSPKSWIEKLEPLLVDKSFREQTSKLQHNYVTQNRNYAVNGMLWEVLYKELIKNLCLS